MNWYFIEEKENGSYKYLLFAPIYQLPTVLHLVLRPGSWPQQSSRWIWPMGIPGKRSEGRRKMRLRYLFFLSASSFWLLLSRKGPCFTVLCSSGFPVTSSSSGPFGSRCGVRSIGNSLGFAYIPCTYLYLVPLIMLTCHLFTVEIQIQPINTL